MHDAVAYALLAAFSCSLSLRWQDDSRGVLPYDHTRRVFHFCRLHYDHAVFGHGRAFHRTGALLVRRSPLCRLGGKSQSVGAVRSRHAVPGMVPRAKSPWLAASRLWTGDRWCRRGGAGYKERWPTRFLAGQRRPSVHDCLVPSPDTPSGTVCLPYISYIIIPALLIVSSVTFGPELLVMFERAATDLYADAGQGEIRFTVWLNGLRALAESPLVGWGPGAFSGLHEPFEGFEAHNTLIDWAASTGALGLALHAALWVWCASRALRMGVLPLFGVWFPS